MDDGSNNPAPQDDPAQGPVDAPTEDAPMPEGGDHGGDMPEQPAEGGNATPNDTPASE